MRKRRVIIRQLSDNNLTDLFQQSVDRAGDQITGKFSNMKLPQWNVGINPQDRETVNAFMNGKAKPTVNVELGPETQYVLNRNIEYLTKGIVISTLGFAAISLFRRK